MNTLIQKYFPWIKACVSFTDAAHIRYQLSSINKKVDCTLALSTLHPHSIPFKQPSRMAGIITFIAVAAMFGSAQAYLMPSTDWTLAGLVVAESVALIVAIIAGCFFWNTCRKRILFTFNDRQTVAFALLDKPDAQLTAFKDTFITKTLKAKLQYDEDLIVLLNKEIPRLTRENIINREFEQILSDRLLMMQKTSVHG